MACLHATTRVSGVIGGRSRGRNTWSGPLRGPQRLATQLLEFKAGVASKPYHVECPAFVRWFSSNSVQLLFGVQAWVICSVV